MLNYPIIQSCLLKQISKTFAAVFLIVLLILISGQLLRAVSSVNEGRITLDFLFLMLTLTNVKSMALVLPIVLFLSIILALSRFYKDSEMIAMRACGISPVVVLQSLLPLIVLFTLIEFFLAVYITPWTNAQITRVIHLAQSKADIDLLDAGQFNIFSYGNKVIYAREINQGKLKQVFLQIRTDKGVQIIYADRAAVIEKPSQQQNNRYLVFTQGVRYDGQPGSDNYQRITFDQYGVLIEDKGVKPHIADFDEMPPAQLRQNTDIKARAEWQWRLSLVINLFVLSLLAIPLADTKPRKGRFSRVFPALIVYFLYTNLITLFQNFMVKGKLPAVLGVWPVHALFILFLLFLYYRYLGGFSFFHSAKAQN